MGSERRQWLSPAMVVALLALVLGTVGGAVAGTLITGAQVKDGSLTGADVKNRSLGAADLSAAAVRSLRGQRGPQGIAGPAGLQGPSGLAGPAGTPGAAIFDGPIPSGKTVTGTWGTIVGSPVAAEPAFFLEAFPVRAPVPLVGETVEIGVHGPAGGTSLAIVAAARGVDENPLCTGSFLTPTAPAGMVCVYVREGSLLNVAADSLSVFPLEVEPSPANVYGFSWLFRADVAGTDARAEGTWAYTAP